MQPPRPGRLPPCSRDRPDEAEDCRAGRWRRASPRAADRRCCRCPASSRRSRARRSARRPRRAGAAGRAVRCSRGAGSLSFMSATSAVARCASMVLRLNCGWVAIAATSLNTGWRSGPASTQLVAVTRMDAVRGGEHEIANNHRAGAEVAAGADEHHLWLARRVRNFRRAAYHRGSQSHSENGNCERSSQNPTHTDCSSRR